MAKVVMSTIPIYTMSCYETPVKVENEIEKVLRKLLWEGSKRKKRIPIIGWDMTCRGKFDGGVGL